jgi:septal ring factor EnvC (AmiA/AmiB activator)
MDYQCGHSVGRHHETADDGYPICPKCLHAERDRLRDEVRRQAEQIKAWRNKADSELDLNARLHTETAHLQEQLAAKEETLREAKARIVQLENDACVLRGQIEHGKE